jgi:hypothetical protein
MHQTQRPEGYEEALQAIEANTSPRYKRLAELERWVAGTQYQGRCDWFNDEKPLWERAPCIVYPVVDISIQSYVDLLLGEGRFPDFEELGPDGKRIDDTGRFLLEYHRLSHFKAFARDSVAAAMGSATTVGIHGARDGKPFSDSVPAKWCVPNLGKDNEVLSLEIRYPYLEEYKRPDRKWAVRAKLYRRTIDAEKDITYFPADADKDGKEPVWRADPDQSFPHGLGFCPVIWYPFMKGTAPVNRIDGHAIHELLLDEIQAHDIALSQRHRCALLSEPQPYEIGVEPGTNPTSSGRQAGVPSSASGGMVTHQNPLEGTYQYELGINQGARKKGPGYVWQYGSPDTKVGALTIGSDALKAQDENARDIRIKLMESLGVVLLDPESIKFASTTSGKALEAIKRRQLDRADKYRDDVADNFLIPTVNMQLQIASVLGNRLAVQVPRPTDAD